MALMVALYTDTRYRKLPNYLTFPVMLIGLVYHLLNGGLSGLIFSVAGLLLGMALLFLPYLIGGMGAGDAKLLGAIGALLGPKGVLITFLATAIVGGIYAMGLLAFHGNLKEAFERYWAILKAFIFTGKLIYIHPSKREEKPKLRYGVAIALGTMISLVFFQKLL